MICRYTTQLLLVLLLGGCGWANPETAPQQSRIELEPPAVRVLLLKASEVQVGCQGGRLQLAPLANHPGAKPFSANERLTVRREGQRWRMTDPDGRARYVQEGIATHLDWQVQSDGARLLTVGDKTKRYRGKLHLIGLDSDTLAVVNVLDMETYLKGVVGAEVYSAWHMAALRAQAVASRTYALERLHRSSARSLWDLGSGQGDQVYAGTAREHERVSQAVDETRGIVLTYGPGGREKLFPAFYHSTCGGHTEDAGVVFGVPASPLRGVDCPYCAAVAKPHIYRWQVDISKEHVSGAVMARLGELQALEEIVAITPVQEAQHGRIERIRLTGRNGMTRTIKASDFRLAVTTAKKPLRSSWYTLEDGGNVWRFRDGHGWGHGVGMCQCGSQGMARHGADAIQILRHYYPGATLLRAW